MLSPLPRRSDWAYCFAHFTQPCQPSPIWQSGRPAHCPFRGLFGVHSRYGLHTRAVTVFRDTLSEGFSHFVTSIAAPVASGWSGCRVGFAPTGKRRLFTAHANCGLRIRAYRSSIGVLQPLATERSVPIDFAPKRPASFATAFSENDDADEAQPCYTTAQPQTRRRSPQCDVELMTGKQVLGFEPASPLEDVSAEHHEQVQDGKHRTR